MEPPDTLGEGSNGAAAGRTVCQSGDSVLNSTSSDGAAESANADPLTCNASGDDPSAGVRNVHAVLSSEPVIAAVETVSAMCQCPCPRPCRNYDCTSAAAAASSRSSEPGRSDTALPIAFSNSSTTK